MNNTSECFTVYPFKGYFLVFITVKCNVSQCNVLNYFHGIKVNHMLLRNKWESFKRFSAPYNVLRNRAISAIEGSFSHSATQHEDATNLYTTNREDTYLSETTIIQTLWSFQPQNAPLKKKTANKIIISQCPHSTTSVKTHLLWKGKKSLFL